MRYRLILLILPLFALLAVSAGFAYVHWSKGGTGTGLYSRYWSPDPVQGYWDPDNFYQSVKSVEGVFKAALCIQCHEGITPGIVADWRASRHGQSDNPVYCNDCHGSDHQHLRLPTPEVCGNCHQKQHGEFKDEARYGFPSHVLAMERAVDAKHFVDKPKGEVQSCVQCHSVATKCDSCHTRHRFDAAEARRPEACITCHSGPPHPDDETYFASAHGKLYLAEGNDWDWSKPLTKGNYKAPTCAYCHMDGGRHQVAHKSLWKFGLREVNPHTSKNQVLRKNWIKLCGDCHEQEKARQWLTELDQERKRAWQKLYAAEDILKDLRSDNLLQPAAGERPPYPMDWMDRLWPRERIGFFEGQASAFYNVSAIERDYFEMWYFDNLGAYKSAAHGNQAGVESGHRKMAASLDRIETKASELYHLSDTEQRAEITPEASHEIWMKGAYTDYNRKHN
ncbi:MAG: hydroxylamine oxidoreductase [Candidatus Thiodiazotropha sp.]|nr:hydroxylamine oxidoreductase [Candidatus Thiodiazotropha sp.]MCM8881782.1 hydroxylamine oxidoreductase [Candidatus Thiodiazotropha sp.]MCM8920353.1 hydroxylamine oxidoreductase [Candidatus Thiodiazotropha sp.]